MFDSLIPYHKRMFCIRCQREVYYCICPDIEARLKALSEHKNWAIEWCTGCDNAKDRCTCPDVPPSSNEPINPVFRSWGRFVSWVKTLSILPPTA